MLRAGQQRPQVRGVMLKGRQEPGHSGLTDKLRNLNFLQSACGSYTSFIIRDDIIHLVFFLKVPLAPGLEGGLEWMWLARKLPQAKQQPKEENC